MTKEQREELKNGIMPLLNTICSMRGLGFDDVEKELLDFIESEVEKANKEYFEKGFELGRLEYRGGNTIEEDKTRAKLLKEWKRLFS